MAIHSELTREFYGYIPDDEEILATVSGISTDTGTPNHFCITEKRVGYLNKTSVFSMDYFTLDFRDFKKIILDESNAGSDIIFFWETRTTALKVKNKEDASEFVAILKERIF